MSVPEQTAPDHAHDYAVPVAYRIDYLATIEPGAPAGLTPQSVPHDETFPRYMGEARTTVVALACSRCGRIRRVPWEGIVSPFDGPTTKGA